MTAYTNDDYRLHDPELFGVTDIVDFLKLLAEGGVLEG